MTHLLKLAIFGASGRNGKRLIALSAVDPSLSLVGAIVGKESNSLRQDAGVVSGIGPIGLELRCSWPTEVDVVIDFSTPQACMEALDHCIANGIAMVIATTGLTSEHVERILQGAERIPICYAPNMSVAVNLAMKLVEYAARVLKTVPGGADVEIIERHHRFKEDSPSGTALKFGQIVANEMGLHHQAHGRQGMVGKRPHDEVGYHAVRVGDDPGQHTIIFGMMGETVEVRVAASNRDCYANGAISAAKFLIGKPPKLYSMMDVLELESKK